MGTPIGGGTNGRVLYDNSGAIGELPVTGSAGNVVLSTSPTIASPTLTGTVTGPAGTWTASGLNLAGGGLGITSGTSGGIPYFSSTSTVASSGALTSGMPVFGGGAGAAPVVGTISGTGTKLATASGSYTSGNCIKSDASGNLIDAGAACSTGSSPILLATLSGGGTSYSDSTHFTSTYKSYTIIINELIPSSATNTNNNCIIAVKVAGVTQTTNYGSQALISGGSPGWGIPCSAQGTAYPISTGIGVTAKVLMAQSNFGSSGKVMFTGQGTFQNTIAGAGSVVPIIFGGNFNTAAIVNGIEIYFTNNAGTVTSSGITSGTVSIYGNP